MKRILTIDSERFLLADGVKIDKRENPVLAVISADMSEIREVEITKNFYGAMESEGIPVLEAVQVFTGRVIHQPESGTASDDGLHDDEPEVDIDPADDPSVAFKAPVIT